MYNELIHIFKKYPEVFPSGYFRFLKNDLNEIFRDQTYIYKNGVFLSWKVYKRKTKYFLKGDIKIKHFVNKDKGNGEAKKIFQEFLDEYGHDDIYLFCLQSNECALSFYKKNDFKAQEVTGDRVLLKREGQFFL